MSNVRLEHTGAVELLSSFPENSIDAIVTDPPYEIGFMNHGWDRSGVAFDPATWAAALRVLKPGGYLLSFAGARTYHRIACAIEDAGFEIRDQIMWITGQGMPKSVDVGWALHQKAARTCGDMIEESSEKSESVDERFTSSTKDTARVESSTQHTLRFVRASYLQTPVYACAECGQVLQPFLSEQESSSIRAAWTQSQAVWPEQSGMERRGDAEASQGQLQGCPLCPLSAGVVADGAEGWLHRGTSLGDGSIPWQVPNADGSRPSYRPQSVEQLAHQPIAFSIERRAQGFRGFGSSLKPAHEPIVVARKRFADTLAQNVLEYGTGAINIGGCRVPTDNPDETGRWPANVCHDGSDEVVSYFPDAPGQQAAVSTKAPSSRTKNVYGAMKRFGPPNMERRVSSDEISVPIIPTTRQGEASANRRYTEKGATNFAATPGERRFDTGSAARFFYCAKPSRKERNLGLEDPGPQFQHGVTLRKIENTETKGNTHPTVKPLALMRWLLRMVTPPGGTVLDMFVGSGTTGMAAVLEGFDFIGGDNEANYIAIAKARIDWAIAEAGTRG